MLIFEQTKENTGLAIEFKSPGNAVAVASEVQEQTLLNLRRCGWKTLVSNDYDEILLTIAGFLRESRLRCDCCEQLFASDELLKQHRFRKKRSRVIAESAAAIAAP